LRLKGARGAGPRASGTARSRPRGGRRGRNRRIREPLARRGARLALRCARLALLVSIIPALGAAGWLAYETLTTTEALAVKTIKVSGAKRVTREEVIAISGIEPGMNILTFNTARTVERLESDPWIERASVERRAPDTVRIEITERVPVALVKLDAMYVMDASGVVFKEYSPEDELDLPVITGFTKDGLRRDMAGLTRGVVELMAVLGGTEGFNLDDVSEIHADAVFGLSVYTLEEGVRLDLGTGNIRAKLASFERVRALRGGVLSGIEAIDLSDYRSVVVSFVTNVV